jgi:hypothetical protein
VDLKADRLGNLSLELWESNGKLNGGLKELSRCAIEVLWGVEVIENY